MRKRYQPATAMRPLFAVLALSLFLSTRIQAQDEKLDMTTIQKIRQEGLQDSHVMDIAFHLTDASGDRLTLLLQGGGPDRVVVVDLHQGQVMLRTGLAH